jgi:hypothetical protein
VREAGGDAAGPAPAPYDAGAKADAGLPADAGSVCDYVGCDCTAIPCGQGLECAEAGICVEIRTCSAVGEECADDSECCPRDDPTKGAWCSEEGKCTACSRAAGRCTSDYDCCPAAYETPPLACKKTGTCELGCFDDGDCAEPTPVCHLLDRDCLESLCSRDLECAFPLACTSGRCGPEPIISFGSCAVLSKDSTITKGARVQLHAAMFKDDELVPRVVFDWTSSDPARVFVDSAGVATGMDVAGQATISAAASGIPCGTVRLTNVLPVETGRVRVFVLDGALGVPIQGAAVVVGDMPPVATDYNGAVTVASGPADVHVFHPDYSYTSVIGAGLDDYVVHLPRRENTAGGFRGGFDFPPGGYGLNVGIAGCGITDVFGLSLDRVLGERLFVHLKLETSKGAPVDFNDFVWLASGMQLDMNGEVYETSYIVPFNYAPRCDRPGLNVAWGLGNAWPPMLIEATPIAGMDYPPFLVYLFGTLAGGGLGLTGRLDAPPLPMVETPLGGWGGTTPIFDEPYMPDRENFPRLDVELRMPLMLKTLYTMPKQPTLGGWYVDSMLAIGGVLVPGMGFVPLGFEADADGDTTYQEPSDGLLDARYADPSVPPGSLLLRIAPPHAGLEERRFLSVFLALDTTASGADDPFVINSTAVSATLVPSDRVEALRDLSQKPFLAFPEGFAISASERKIVTAEAAGAGLYRSKLKTSDGNIWYVFSSPSAGAEVALPAVPSGLPDVAPDTGMVVHAVVLRDSFGIGDAFSLRGAFRPDDWLENVEQFAMLKCLEKIPSDATDFPKRCQPARDSRPDPACNPACEGRGGLDSRLTTNDGRHDAHLRQTPLREQSRERERAACAFRSESLLLPLAQGEVGRGYRDGTAGAAGRNSPCPLLPQEGDMGRSHQEGGYGQVARRGKNRPRKDAAEALPRPEVGRTSWSCSAKARTADGTWTRPGSSARRNGGGDGHDESQRDRVSFDCELDALLRV